MALDTKVDVESTGKPLVRTYGRRLTVVPALIDFSDVTSYTDGGEEVDFSSYFPTGVVTVIIPPKGDQLFEYDEEDEKVIVQGATDGEDLSDLGEVRCIVYGQ